MRVTSGLWSLRGRFKWKDLALRMSLLFFGLVYLICPAAPGITLLNAAGIFIAVESIAFLMRGRCHQAIVESSFVFSVHQDFAYSVGVVLIPFGVPCRPGNSHGPHQTCTHAWVRDAAVCASIARWRNVTIEGQLQRSPGLVNRRADEVAMFLGTHEFQQG